MGKSYQQGEVLTALDLNASLAEAVNATGSYVFTGVHTHNARLSYNSNYTESISSASVTGTYNIDWSQRNAYRITMTGPTTLTFTNPPAADTMQTLTIILEQDAVGSRAITWPTNVRWSYGQAPVITTTPLKRDVFTFITVDNGTTFSGAWSMANVAIS